MQENENKKEKEDFRLGQILVQIGVITPGQLQKALIIKDTRPSKLLGQILLEEGYCTEKDVKKGLERQRNETSVGQILLRSGIVNQAQIDECVKEQEETGSLLGFILVRKCYCTTDQLITALRAQKRDNRLGALMLREGYINEKQLETALMEQQKTSILLGELLIRLEFITSDELADILILQSKLANEFPE